MTNIVQSKAAGKNIFMTVFFLAAFFMLTIFFIDQLYQSSQKPFWGDEIYGMHATTRGNSYLGLLLGGARHSQSSPAPLDYLLLKPLDSIAAAISCLGLKVEVYYRLIANLSTTLAALGIFILFASSKLDGVVTSKQTRHDTTRDQGIFILQGVLVIFAMIAFLFSRYIHYYAAEMRPYAIWNAMYMLTLAVGILRPTSNKLFMGAMILLGFSATASIFQLVLLGAAYFWLNGIEEDWKKAFIKSVKIFSLPVLVSLFYCLRVGQWEMVDAGSTWNDFLDVWINKATIIPLMLTVIVCSLIKKETRMIALVPLGYLLLFIAGPLIFKLTQARGYFYSERQYGYYDLGTAIFLLSTVRLIPYYLKPDLSKLVMVGIFVLIVVIGGSLTFRKKVSRKWGNAVRNSSRLMQNPQPIQYQPADLKLYF